MRRRYCLSGIALTVNSLSYFATAARKGAVTNAPDEKRLLGFEQVALRSSESVG